MAGAASGVLNTVRHTGSALGSAVVLAVLQNRVAAHDSFVTAMRAAIAAPIAVLILAALLCVAVEGARRQQAAPPPAAAAAAQAPASES
jgi:hypothetical protein